MALTVSRRRAIGFGIATATAFALAYAGLSSQPATQPQQQAATTLPPRAAPRPEVTVDDVIAGRRTAYEHRDWLKENVSSLRQAISDGVVADLYVYPEEEGKFIQYYRTHGLPVPDQAELESYRELTKLAMFTTPAPGGFTMEGHQMPVPVLLHQRIYNNKSNTNRDLHAVIKHEVTHAYDYFFGITNLPNNRANKKLVVELRGNHDGLSDILEDFARFNKYTGSEEYFTDAALNYGTLYVFAEYITQGMQLPVQAAQKRDIESSVKALLLYEPEEYYALKSEERLMLASSMLPLKGISARLTNYQGTQAILIHPDSKYKARGDFLVTITDLSR